jgi:hypothetical protein
MKAYEGVDVYIHVFLTSALVGGELSTSRLGRFTPGERAPGTHWLGGWVGPRTGLDDVEKIKFMILPRLELRPLGRPARSQALYRLSYLGSWRSKYRLQNCGLILLVILRGREHGCRQVRAVHGPHSERHEAPTAFLHCSTHMTARSEPKHVAVLTCHSVKCLAL